MANRGGNAQYDTAQVIKNSFQEEDNSELEDSDVESGEKDHLSEYSNYSDIESLEESCSDGDEVNNCSTRGNGDQSSRERGQGGVVQVNARVADQTQNIYVGKNGTIWQKQPPVTARRQTQDIIRLAPGITSAVNFTSTKQAFSSFITEVMIDLLVMDTDREARRKIDEWNLEHPDLQRTWIPVDDTEITAFIGLNLLAGLHKSNHEPISTLWSEKEGRSVYIATMSRNRFTDILRYLRFDNRATREERRATDKLAAFRDFWTLFQAQLRKFYIPGTDLCVDEQLVAFRGRCSFRQYIPSKPAKYGIKIWWCCDAQTSYPLNGQVYLGKQPDQPREVGQGARVFKDMVAPWYRSGKNVTADNFFTSIPLAEDLLQNGLTYVGTIRSNKAEIPAEMKPNNNREVYSSMFGFKDQVTLVSYVPKKDKSVKALSTMHHDTAVEGEDRKPEIILHYNATKSGVDNLDYLCTLYTCRRKVNRWPVVLFGNCNDVGAVAAFVTWMAKYPEWKSSEGGRRRRVFLLELGHELVMPNIKRRAAISGLRSSIRMAISLVGVNPAAAQDVQVQGSVGQKRRCSFCSRKDDKKVRRVCDSCYKHVCPTHSKQQIICVECQQR